MELKKIKLNKLAENSLAERQMQGIKGGNSCACGCAYANRGGSSTNDNYAANYKGGYEPIIDGGELPPVYVIGKRRH